MMQEFTALDGAILIDNPPGPTSHDVVDVIPRAFPPKTFGQLGTLGDFRLACTKGTYVGTVAHELGQKLGCGAHVAALRRVTSGKFEAADALPLEKVLQFTPRELETHVIPFLKLAAG